MKTFSLPRAFFAILMLTLAFASFRSDSLTAQRRLVNTDDVIVDQVEIRLADDPIVKGGAIQVDCKDGVVTLRGSVETEKQKARAEHVARKVKGVKQVVNELAVGQGSRS